MNALVTLVLLTQSLAPVSARADDLVKAAAFVPEIERIVVQGAGAVTSGASDLTAAGRRALENLRRSRVGEVINADNVKLATRQALAQVGRVLSDVDFERLFTEQSKIVVAALARGELGLSFDELSFGKGPIAMFEGFGTVALACLNNTLSSAVCVTAGGIAVLVGIVLIAQALTRPAGTVN